MSAKDWYARKLGGGQPAQQPSSLPPTRFNAPGVPPGPGEVHAPQQQQDGFVRTPDGKVDVPASAANWRGGAGNADVQNCPNCGSVAYYSPSAGGTGIAGRDAGKYMRQCYDCGYPVVQFGSVGGRGEQLAAGGGA